MGLKPHSSSYTRQRTKRGDALQGFPATPASVNQHERERERAGPRMRGGEGRGFQWQVVSIRPLPTATLHLLHQLSTTTRRQREREKKEEIMTPMCRQLVITPLPCNSFSETTSSSNDKGQKLGLGQVASGLRVAAKRDEFRVLKHPNRSQKPFERTFSLESRWVFFAS